MSLEAERFADDPRQRLREDPSRTAVMLDVDGVLAPIVAEADQARVPAETRALLTELADRYGLVACVSGRRAADARRVVGLDTITYVGSHGAETLRPGGDEPDVDPQVLDWAQRVHTFAHTSHDAAAARLGIRLEDKATIVALHWRGAPDEDLALRTVRDLAARAEQAGFTTHWGRKVLEIRPPVPIDKGLGVRRLLTGTGIRAAVYIGDDATDIDAFRALTALLDAGEIDHALRVGVASDEGPTALSTEADIMIDGTEQVAGFLGGLLGGIPRREA